MFKDDAIKLLGGSVAVAADTLGVTRQAIAKWPEVLPQRIADRVQGALYRQQNGIPHPRPKAGMAPGGSRVEQDRAACR
jgi:hypothetical protein